ncbi:MAG TPA: hypothetical protein VHM19_12595, partial [Polyangiales bacterium]|nr:hypothetical protein [Polyangiales bacterium]
AVGEALFFSKKLGDYGIQPAAVIVNRVHASAPLPKSLDASEVAALMPEVADPAALLTRMRQAGADQLALARRDREGIRRLREHIGERLSYTEVPALDQDVHELRSLAQVADYLFGVST